MSEEYLLSSGLVALSYEGGSWARLCREWWKEGCDLVLLCLLESRVPPAAS